MRIVNIFDYYVRRRFTHEVHKHKYARKKQKQTTDVWELKVYPQANMKNKAENNLKL